MFTFIYDTDIAYIVVVGADFKMDAILWKKWKKELQKVMCLHYPHIYHVWITISPKYPDLISSVINLMVTRKRTGNQNKTLSNKKKCTDFNILSD